MTSDANGPCFHCLLSEHLQQYTKQFPNKPVTDITMELTEILADYVACTAPAGEMPSALLTIGKRLEAFAKQKREEAIKRGWVTEVTVQ